MKLKELVQKVQQAVDENKEKWLPSVSQSMPFYFSKEQQETLYASFASYIEPDEILNINKTMWDSGMTYRLHREVVDAIAIGLYVQCRTKDERDAMAAQFDAKTNEIRDVNLRLNRIPKGKHEGIDARLGIYDKIEFIQKFGAMYNNTDEANADANDPNGICPLIMGVLNSGWHNIMAAVENGKVMVKKMSGDDEVTPSMVLISIKNAFSVFIDRKDAQAVRDTIKSVYVFDKVQWRSLSVHGGYPIRGELFCSKEERHELINAMMSIMMDEGLYPQGVYDFRTYNTMFIKFVMAVVAFMDRFDETQTHLCRQVVDSILDVMEKTSKLECRIIKEQQIKDPVTGKFIKPLISILRRIPLNVLRTPFRTSAS